MTTPVIYDISIGKHKPHSGAQTSCPFCHRETLTDILDEKGDIIWLMNKYPVFRNTYPTVIIESAVHEADLTEYTKKKARQVISATTVPVRAVPSAIPTPRLSGLRITITETISTAKTFWEQFFMKTRIALLPFHHTPYAAWGN